MKPNILCIGDIVGRPGRRILADKLKQLVTEREIDCVIANAENAAVRDMIFIRGKRKQG